MKPHNLTTDQSTDIAVLGALGIGALIGGFAVWFVTGAVWVVAAGGIVALVAAGRKARDV